MCRIMKELLICWSSEVASTIAVVWALIVLPIRSSCSIIRYSAVWNEVSILNSTFWREDSSCWMEGPGADSLQSAVRASAMTSRVGLESCALETAWGGEPEMLLVCGVKSTYLPSSDTALRLHQCVYTTTLRQRMIAVPSCLPKASSCAWSNETVMTFLGPIRQWMAAVTCTCRMFRGSPLTTMVVDRAVGEFGLVVMSLEGVVMTTL